MIYLDNAATTRLDPNVLLEMVPFLTEQYGNPGSVHSFGRESAEAIDKARKRVADFINADPSQIVFTSGGSEANNLAISGIMKNQVRAGRRYVVVSKVEHDSIISVADTFDNAKIWVDNLCIVQPEYVESVLSDIGKCYGVGLVSVMYVNNETGSVNNVKEICDICHRHGVLFHTDCVQAAGCEEIDVEKIGCDLLSISSHKINGPKGVGALYVKNKNLLEPLIYGGELQEHGLRGGTENVAGIVGFGKACELAMSGRQDFHNTVSYYRKLFYSLLVNELKENKLDKIVHVNGAGIEEGSGKTLNIRFENIDAETLVLLADSEDVCISAGSACRSRESQPSRVLIAMGLTPDEARDSIRISFSNTNSIADVANGARIIAECVSKLNGVLNNG